MVEMHVVEGAVNVGMSGVAEDAGMMGDIIRVLNPQTKKQLSGVVIAKGIVELK
jgi:flagella basal body P-ring formation protein FlgA